MSVDKYQRKAISCFFIAVRVLNNHTYCVAFPEADLRWLSLGTKTPKNADLGCLKYTHVFCYSLRELL